MNALKDLIKSAPSDNSGMLQFIIDAGANPNTGKDQVFSPAFPLHRKPKYSHLDSTKFNALDPIEKLIHWLTYSPIAYSLACFLGSSHTNGMSGFRRIFRPGYKSRFDILHEPGFGLEDVNRVVCRSDWINLLRQVFIYGKSKTFYLCEFSARLVSIDEDLCLKPKSDLVGLAHTFLPHDEKGFATEICHHSDDFVEVKIAGLDSEQRQSLRAKLEADAEAVPGDAEMEDEYDDEFEVDYACSEDD